MESSSPYRPIAHALCCLGLLLCVFPVQAALVWHWEDDFSAAERAKMQHWLEKTHEALERYAAPLPFDVHLYLHRREDSNQPVPWANTRRESEQALHFYVDPSFSRDSFMKDWTAAHEFSHLLFPYLGRKNAWFSEGFASYLQHSVMVEMGVIDRDEAKRRREAKMRAAMQELAGSEKTLPESVSDLRAGGKYPTFYWGGAIYFQRVDSRLREEGASLQSVVASYVECCRGNRISLDDLVLRLDALHGGRVFSDELVSMRTLVAVPMLNNK